MFFVALRDNRHHFGVAGAVLPFPVGTPLAPSSPWHLVTSPLLLRRKCGAGGTGLVLVAPAPNSSGVAGRELVTSILLLRSRRPLSRPRTLAPLSPLSSLVSHPDPSGTIRPTLS